MGLKSLLAAIGTALIMGGISYLILVSNKQNTIYTQLDGLKEISFLQRHKVVHGEVWVQFEDGHSHWRSTARSLAIYLSTTTKSRIVLRVASRKMITLAPKLGSTCDIISENGVIEKDDCASN